MDRETNNINRVTEEETMRQAISKQQRFEEYLQDIHAAQYQGLDDEMPDNFNEWLEELSPDEWIGYAEKWCKRYI